MQAWVRITGRADDPWSLELSQRLAMFLRNDLPMVKVCYFKNTSKFMVTFGDMNLRDV
jgi:hypothetical protein